MAGFDPYRKWLGIPPAEQPPNHYRLLGIGLFESDAEVIASAADRQMSHVRNFQSGGFAGDRAVHLERVGGGPGLLARSATARRSTTSGCGKPCRRRTAMPPPAMAMAMPPGRSRGRPRRLSAGIPIRPPCARAPPPRAGAVGQSARPSPAAPPAAGRAAAHRGPAPRRRRAATSSRPCRPPSPTMGTPPVITRKRSRRRAWARQSPWWRCRCVIVLGFLAFYLGQPIRLVRGRADQPLIGPGTAGHPRQECRPRPSSDATTDRAAERPVERPAARVVNSRFADARPGPAGIRRRLR